MKKINIYIIKFIILTFFLFFIGCINQNGLNFDKIYLKNGEYIKVYEGGYVINNEKNIELINLFNKQQYENCIIKLEFIENYFNIWTKNEKGEFSFIKLNIDKIKIIEKSIIDIKFPKLIFYKKIIKTGVTFINCIDVKIENCDYTIIFPKGTIENNFKLND